MRAVLRGAAAVLRWAPTPCSACRWTNWPDILVDLVRVLSGWHHHASWSTGSVRSPPGTVASRMLDQFLMRRGAEGPQPPPEVVHAWRRAGASGGAVPDPPI